MDGIPGQDQASDRLLSLLSPEFLQRYQLGRLLGRGGMGAVYQATEAATGRAVAVKFMSGGLFEGDDAEARFFNEAAAMEGVDHPNLVQVLGAGKDGATPYIVFEYVEGRTLKELIQEKGRLPVFEALAIARGMLDGLRVAHTKQIIHRDIKSENVLLDAQGVAKVADFGIAKSDRPQQTKTGVIIGTPAYMAPEQAMGKKLDVRCDVYSAGIVLFEMLTGRLPFGEENSMQTMMAHINEPVPAPSYVVPGLPQLLDDLLAGALAKTREGRYPSAGGFGIAIDRSVEKLRQVGFAGLRPGAQPAPAAQGLDGAGTRAVHLESSSNLALGQGATPVSQTRAATTEQLHGVVPSPGLGPATQRVLESTRVPTGAGVTMPRKLEGKDPTKLALAAGAGLLLVLGVAVGAWRAMSGGPAVPVVDPAALEGPEAAAALATLEGLAAPDLTALERQSFLATLPRNVPEENFALRDHVLRRLEAIQAEAPVDAETDRAFRLGFVSLGHVPSYQPLLQELSRGSPEDERAQAFQALVRGLDHGGLPDAETTEELARALWNLEKLSGAGPGEYRPFLQAAGALGGEHGAAQLKGVVEQTDHTRYPDALRAEAVKALETLAYSGRPGSKAAQVHLSSGIQGEEIEMNDDEALEAVRRLGKTFEETSGS